MDYGIPNPESTFKGVKTSPQYDKRMSGQGDGIGSMVRLYALQISVTEGTFESVS
jgi:hypothetical protein